MRTLKMAAVAVALAATMVPSPPSSASTGEPPAPTAVSPRLAVWSASGSARAAGAESTDRRAVVALAPPAWSRSIPAAVAAPPPATTPKPSSRTRPPAKPVTTGPTSTRVTGSLGATLACIRAHESDTAGGYHATNGTHWGAYQFAPSTWDNTARHAGRLDLVGVRPDRASPADQDAMAVALLTWPGVGGLRHWTDGKHRCG